MGWLTLGLKFVPMIVGAITKTENESKKKGREKQEEALHLIQTIASITALGSEDQKILNKTQPETRALIDALVGFLNAATSAETPEAQP
jgi:hypothetical protein|tara:strand:- start:530 stop:796 length:267 start_codon:yes stop_codon:yes gene_type:complete